MAEWTAGRELDALVHIRVMGHTDWSVEWSVSEGVRHVAIRAPGISSPARYYTYPLRPPTAEWPIAECGASAFVPLGFPDLPHYSTNIADAWRIVEGAGAFTFRVDRWERGPGGGATYHAIVFSRSVEVPGAWDRRFEATADTAALAICLASLKAVGVAEQETP